MQNQNKYLSIYQDIVGRIESGKWKPDEKLPSENEMVEMFEVSRETVRKALNLLAQHGYIQKIRGKGSVVLDMTRYDFPVSGVVSFKELAEKMGTKPRTILYELALLKPDEYLVDELSLGKGDDAWKVLRVREIGDEKIILDKDYFNTSYVPHLTREACENSIYAFLEEEQGLEISFAKKEITVEKPTDEDRKYLDLGDYDAVVVVRSHVYLKNASLFQYTESRHRPDKFRFVDFARRQHI